MGASRPKTPKPSPEIQSQLQQQTLLSQRLAEQQAQFEKQYQQQLAQVQASYDQQYSLLNKQFEQQSSQYSLLTQQLQAQLDEAIKSREAQAEEYRKLLESQNAATELSAMNASRSRYEAQTTAAQTTNNVNRLFTNNSRSQQLMNINSLLRGSTSGYGNVGNVSLLRR